MPVYPETDAQRLIFCQAHAPLWVTNAAAIGVVPATATALQTATTTAQTAYDDMITARNAAKSATLNFRNKAAIMNDQARGIIGTVKAYAESRNDPNVYVLADIPAPAAPTPVPPPSMPTDFNAAIDGSGQLTLTWKAERRGPTTGVFFEVSRKSGTQLEFTVINATAETSYIDPGFASFLASGPGNVSYRIRAIRGSNASPYVTPILINLTGENPVVASIGGGGSTAMAA